MLKKDAAKKRQTKEQLTSLYLQLWYYLSKLSHYNMLKKVSDIKTQVIAIHGLSKWWNN